MSNQLQMQPTFRVQLPWNIDEAKDRLRTAIKATELAGRAESAGRVLDYKVESDAQRFWSPHLSVQLYPTDQPESTEAFCRFSPRPEIWTMVMAVYLVAACCFFGSLIYGFVQWMMGHPPWSLAVVPLSLSAITGLHVASLVGQGWSRDQMHVLQARWERTIEIAKGEPAA